MGYLLIIIIFAAIALAIPLLIAVSIIGFTKLTISKPHKKIIKKTTLLSIPLILSAIIAINGGEQILSGAVSVYTKSSGIKNIYTLENQPIQFIITSAAYILAFISGLCLAFKIFQTIFIYDDSNP
jgi:hypothetical protein